MSENCPNTWQREKRLRKVRKHTRYHIDLNSRPFYGLCGCSLYSDHFAVFAWFSLPKPLSNQSSQITSKYSAVFLYSLFQSKLSTRYYDLLSLPNSSFLQFSFDDHVGFWYQVLLNAISASCHRETNRTPEFPYFYSSHTIHLNIKLDTDAKNNYEPKCKKKLQGDIQ